jgi:molybdopterin/thiamine biosynthesis adenylyltransferase
MTKTSSPTETIRETMDLTLLTRGRVVLIGQGGVGLHLARSWLQFVAGIMSATNDGDEIDFVLCDGDSFELANIYRMDIPDFGNKAAELGQELLARLGDQPIHVRWITDYVSQQNIESIIGEGDFVMLACDNHATRQLINQRCAQGNLQNVVLISGGNDGVEEGLRGTYGNVQVYVREDGQHRTAPLDRFHPEIASPVDSMPDPEDCLQAAVSGTPQISLVNLAVASAMCNAGMRLLMPVPGERMYDEVALDALDAVAVPHWLSGPRYLEK